MKENCIPQKYQEVLRFAIVGVIATLVHYVCYVILNLFMLSWLAYSIGYATSFLLNFYLSSRFTFRSSASVRKGVGFGMSHFINYSLQVLLLSLFIQMGIPENLAPVPVFAITIPINFLLVRFVFKSQKL